MENNISNDLPPLDDDQEREASGVQTEQLVEAEAPYQEAQHKWVFQPRQNPRWGVVTKEGLIVGRGANKKVVPPDEVYYLATLGCSYRELGDWFGVAEDTMRYNFRPYVEKAREEIKHRLRQAQIKYALDGNATLLIWLGKNMLGQSDNPSAVDTDKILPWSDE